MPQLWVLPRQVLLNNGAVAANAVARFYQTGSSTPQSVYTDAALSNAVTSTTASSAGVFSKIYLNPNADANYRVRVETSGGSLIYQEDDIDKSWFSSQSIGELLFDLNDLETNAGVTADDIDPTVPYGKIERYQPAMDGTTDDSAAWQRALDSNYEIDFTCGGTCSVGQLTTGICTHIRGAGGLTSILKNRNGSTHAVETAAALVVFDDVGFEGNGGGTDYGLKMLHSRCQVNRCYFNNLLRGVSQDNVVGEMQIYRSNFGLCGYGVWILGVGINSLIDKCRFDQCDSAVTASDVAVSTTEGVRITNCIAADCGSEADDRAVFDITSCDYTWLIDNVADVNNYISARLSDSKRCRITGIYDSNGDDAPDNSFNVYVQGDCSGGYARIHSEFAGTGGIALAFAGGSSDFTNGFIVDCMTVNGNETDIAIDSCTNIDIRSPLLGGVVNIALNQTHRGATAEIFGGILLGATPATVGGSSCVLKANNGTLGFVTKARGIAVIDNGQTTEVVAHGLNVLSGRSVSVMVTPHQVHELVTAQSVGSTNFTATRTGTSGDNTFSYDAEVV